MIQKLFKLVIILVLSLGAPIAEADVVTLLDGTTVEGKVVKESSAEVVLEIVISNIKTTKTYPRYKVKSIEYKPIETASGEETKQTPSIKDEQQKSDDVDTPAERRPSARDRLQSRKDRTTFMRIPIEGQIGTQTNATGLRNALLQAGKKGVTHVIFTIDSPGGYLYDAIEALKVLKEHDDTFVYHAVVDGGAISAASIYIAAADHIWVRPGSRVGGAVAYSGDTSSGATEVDAKLNSIWAADIAARAETKGHPPEVFRAMVEPAAELWVDEDGKSYPSRPSTKGAQQLDNQSTILTIRADQMIRIGMAKEFDGQLTQLGEQLDLTGWFEVRAIGIRAMEKSAKERQSLHDQYEHAVQVFIDSLEDFERDHPESFRDYRYYRDRNGNMHPDGPSYQRWRQRVDLTVNHLDIMLQALARMASVNKRAAKIGAVHLEYLPDEYGDDVYKELQSERNRVASLRNQPPQP